MRINYISHEWKNDTSPAINETNLNQIEGELKSLIDEVNEYVVENETALVNLKSGEGKLLTREQVAKLTNIDTAPTIGSENLVSSGGVAMQIVEKTSPLLTQIQASQTEINNIKSAVFPGGTVTQLATVARTGNYSDLKTKLIPGDGITIEDNVISSTGGGGSKIPVCPDTEIPVQKEGDIWFRTFE